MKTHVYGIILTAGLTCAAFALSNAIHGLNATCTAILIGMIWGNLFPRLDHTREALQFCESRILPIAIGLMGLELNFFALKDLGGQALLVILPAMILSICAAMLFGKLLRLPIRTALLLGIGNSVCGSSAVLAVSPTLQPRKQEIAVSIAAVNLMGTVGLFLLPQLADVMHLSTPRTAYLIGGSLQAVGQVVASGLSVSDSVGHHALVIKMLRVLMIGPIVLILSQIFGKRSVTPCKRGRLLPGYLVGFAVCSLFASIFHSDPLIIPRLQQLATILMVVAMVGIGSKIQFKTMLQQGSKSIAVTLFSSIILISSVLLLSAWFIR